MDGDRFGLWRARLLVVGVLVALLLSTSPALGQETGEAEPIPTNPTPGAIALTFDDGPFEEWTSVILEILARYDVKATFFISAYRLAIRAEIFEIVEEIVAAGHSVQSHGYGHIWLPARARDKIREELQMSIDLIVAAGAPRPTCFRPPYGGTNDVVVSVAEELGLEVVLWTVDSADTVLQQSTGVIRWLLAHAGAGDIVLMHDQWAPVHRTALPVVIESLLEQGVEFESICAPALEKVTFAPSGFPRLLPL